MTLKKSLALIAVSACIGLSFSVIAAFAWDGPTQTAPNGNVAAPVNVGGVFQNKTGAAWFDGGIGIDDGSAFCIGGDCIDTWPTSPWELAGTSLYYTGGNVGIGTDTPIATLDVNGYARLAPQSAEPVACDAAHIGSIAFSEAAQSLCVCTIEGWDSSTGQACWTTADAPPTVALTAPSHGATVSGTITVTASASDDVGVVDVQFYLDGVKFVVEDAIPPYSRFWDTSTASNGSHTLTAVARDTIDQTTTSNSVTVTVSNSIVSPGSQTFSTPGTYSFTVPAYNTLTVQVWGGGGGGSGFNGVDTPGGRSRFGSTVIAGGGGSGNNDGGDGYGGTASGGTTNTSGGNGSYSRGGNSPNGGTGGSARTAGNAPGGGGGPGADEGIGYGGGAGAYSSRTYSAGQLSGSVTVEVGAGGNGDTPNWSYGGLPGGNGANGRVYITWN